MPQYSAYPVITELLAADKILVYKNSTASLKTITAENFAASIKALTSRALALEVVSSNTTLDDTNEFVVANSGSTFIITLPDSADNPGAPFYLSNKGAGTVTVSPAGTDTIAGQTSLALPQFSSYVLIPDGLGMWHVFSLSS